MACKYNTNTRITFIILFIQLMAVVKVMLFLSYVSCLMAVKLLS